MGRCAPWIIRGILVLGSVMAARTAAAQGYGNGGRAPAAAAGYGMGPSAKPSVSPVLNAYSNPYLYAYPTGPAGAAVVFMAGQRSMAEAAQARAEAARAREVGPRTFGRGMMAPGAGASRYFGGGSMASGPPEERPARFLRQDRYFRPNGY